MWHSTHSTGIREFDDDHSRIDEAIKNVSHTTNPKEEKRLLMDLYCTIIAHIRSKNELPEYELTSEERERDTNFLKNIRLIIWQRDNAQITQLKLIQDLRQMLADHVLHNNKAQKRS